MDPHYQKGLSCSEVVMKTSPPADDEIEKQYKHLVEHLPNAAYACDRAGRILIYNKAAEELWGRTPGEGEVICAAWKVYSIDGVPIEPGCFPVARAIREAKVIQGEELIIERPDGMRRRVVAHVIPDFDSRGNVRFVTSILTDTTQLNEIELKTLTLIDRLQCKNKEQEQFTYLISHILRAPVARILGLASILHLDPQNKEFIVQKIAEETVNLDGVLKDVHSILSAMNSENKEKEYVG